MKRNQSCRIYECAERRFVGGLCRRHHEIDAAERIRRDLALDALQNGTIDGRLPDNGELRDELFRLREWWALTCRVLQSGRGSDKMPPDEAEYASEWCISLAKEIVSVEQAHRSGGTVGTALEYTRAWVWLRFQNLGAGLRSNGLAHERQVVIVGTRHSLQLAALGTPADLALQDLLLELSRVHKVRAIAEELNTEALASGGCLDSVPMRVAKALGLEHRMCDPDTQERTKLGLALDHNSIEARAWLRNGSTPETIAAEVGVEHRKRERVWIERLKALNLWPTLFVCGANHVAGFGSLLELNGIRVVVASPDWEVAT